MKKKILSVALSLLAGLSLFLVVGATPAAAQFSRCPVGQFCTFNGADGTGTMWRYPFSIYGHPAGHCWYLAGDPGYPPGGPSDHDRWSSFWNRYGSGEWIEVYTDDICQSNTDKYLRNNESGNFLGSWNNNVGSFEIF